MRELLLVVVFTACIASGCANFKPVEAGTANSPEMTDPKGAVIKASRKLIALNSLSAIVEGAGQLAIRKDVQFIAPDRYHIKFNDETGANVEMLMIGNESYIKSEDSWNRMAGDISPTPTFRNSFTDDVLESVSDVRFEGEDTLNGKSVYVYSYKLVTKVANFPVTQRLWVDQSSGIPLKSVAEYSDSQVKTLTTTFDTETPVSIEPPAK